MRLMPVLGSWYVFLPWLRNPYNPHTAVHADTQNDHLDMEISLSPTSSLLAVSELLESSLPEPELYSFICGYFRHYFLREASVLFRAFWIHFSPFSHLADKEAGIPPLSFDPSLQVVSFKSEPYDSCWEILFCYNNHSLFPDFFSACRNYICYHCIKMCRF